MKITKLSTYRLAPRWMFLKIETDEGVSGWGEPVIEGRARTVQAAVDELSDYVIGQDPSRINDIWQTLYRGGFYRGGPILMSAIAGIDQALMGHQRQGARRAGLRTAWWAGARPHEDVQLGWW
jgi:galactonate dehydratase